MTMDRITDKIKKFPIFLGTIWQKGIYPIRPIFLVMGCVLLAFGLSSVYFLSPLGSNIFVVDLEQEKLQEEQRFLSEKISDGEVQRPNIILLVADDLGKTDIPLYGNKWVTTPHLDSLAMEGTTFTDAYVTAPICSPSRAGLLTGRYQQRFGYEVQPANRYARSHFEKWIVDHFADTAPLEFEVPQRVPDAAAIAQQGLPVGEITLADVLKKNGYETAIIGKWHLGHDKVRQPLSRGFDYHYGFYEAYSWYADTTNPEIMNVRHKGIMDSFIWKNGNTGLAAKRRNDQEIQVKEYYTNALAKEAVGFIEKNKDKPFFLYVPFSAPHSPFQALKKEVAGYQEMGVKDLNKAVYYALISNLDEAIGQIHQKVKELGLEENTLIIFLSDNGGATYTQATDNAPLKGGKMSLYEGGVNVPFVIKWKGHVPAKTVYSKPVSALDIFATAAAVSSSPLPNDRGYDGVNLLPYMAGMDTTHPHKILYWRSGYNKAIRKGDWKLVMNQKDHMTLLYNLRLDKSESANLAEKQPSIVLELQMDLARWEKTLVTPLWPSVGFFKNIFDGQIDRFTL
jgi:arylsulfatase A-like enzyme